MRNHKLLALAVGFFLGFAAEAFTDKPQTFQGAVVFNDG